MIHEFPPQIVGGKKIFTMPPTPTTRNMHIKYRDFWIRNTKTNRKTVDGFLKTTMPFKNDKWHLGTRSGIYPQPGSGEQVLMSLKDAVLEQSAIVKEAVGRHEEAKKLRELLRPLVKAHPYITVISPHLRRLKNVMAAVRNALIEYCQDGVSEAYLVFHLYFPSMCTREIQPFFNYKASRSSVYTDDNWHSILTDVDFGPLSKDALYMSGFNRMWRTDLVSDYCTCHECSSCPECIQDSSDKYEYPSDPEDLW
jgi:hypothetical protein